tara:strand:+ start:61 stop:351 length:291 start_codon:yes stop_codon:yes gene_type:complete
MDENNNKNKRNNIGNYFISIISACIYIMALHPKTTPLDLTAALYDVKFIPSVLGTLAIPAIISGLIAFFGKKNFSNLFAWFTVILCVISYIGRSIN